MGQVAVIPAGTLLAEAWGFRGVFLAFAALLVAAFVAIAATVRAPAPSGRADAAPWLKTLEDVSRDRGARPAMLAFALLFFGYGALASFYPEWLVTALGASSDDLATLMFAAGVAGVLAAPAAGRLSDRLGRKRVVIGSCLGMAVIAPIVPLAVHAVLPASVCFVVLQALSAGRVAPLQALVTELAPESRRSTLLSVTVAAGSLGAALGGWLAGLLFARWGFAAVGAVAGGALLAASWIVGARVPERALVL